jgi:hypothetical protein
MLPESLVRQDSCSLSDLRMLALSIEISFGCYETGEPVGNNSFEQTPAALK